MSVQQKLNQISIVIPSKNDEITLIKNIDELLTFCEKYVLNFEVIIVVNGSEDKNITILKDYLLKKKLENFKILNSEIIGKGAAVKLGIKLVVIYDNAFSDEDAEKTKSLLSNYIKNIHTGEWSCFFNSHKYLEKKVLQKIYNS